MSSQVTLGIAHNCPAERRGRPILPAEVIRLRSGLRCVHRLPSLRFSGAPSSSLVPYLPQHTSSLGQLYYCKDNFITPSDCSKSKIRRTFLAACDDINTCIQVRSRTTDNQEIVVVVQCVSSKSPSYCGYIVDHTKQTVRWLHERPKDSPNDEYVKSRDIGEYWRHVTMFCAHRHITPGDLQNARSLLLRPANESPLSDEETKAYLYSLEVLSRSEIERECTFTVARIHQDIIERSVPPVIKSHTIPKRPLGLLKNILEFFFHSPCTPDAESILGHPSQHSASSRSSLDGPSRSRVTLGSSSTLQPRTSSETVSPPTTQTTSNRPHQPHQFDALREGLNNRVSQDYTPSHSSNGSPPPSPSGHGPLSARVHFSSPLARTGMASSSEQALHRTGLNRRVIARSARDES